MHRSMIIRLRPAGSILQQFRNLVVELVEEVGGHIVPFQGVADGGFDDEISYDSPMFCCPGFQRC